MKKLILAMVLLLSCLLLAACSSSESTYKSAQDLLSQGKYAEAAKKFESLGSYEDASTLAIYCKACALCESGDYEVGISALEKLGDYKDCPMRITYYTARSWDDNSVGTTKIEWMEQAKSIYNENPLYLDSMERIAALDKRIAKTQEDFLNIAIQNGEFDIVLPFSEGLALVGKDLQFGYIDTTGKLVIPFQWEFAFHFIEGLAQVEKTASMASLIPPVSLLSLFNGMRPLSSSKALHW